MNSTQPSAFQSDVSHKVAQRHIYLLSRCNEMFLSEWSITLRDVVMALRQFFLSSPYVKIGSNDI